MLTFKKTKQNNGVTIKREPSLFSCLDCPFCTIMKI